jgi:hypothetical protein
MKREESRIFLCTYAIGYVMNTNMCMMLRNRIICICQFRWGGSFQRFRLWKQAHSDIKSTTKQPSQEDELLLGINFEYLFF